MGKLIGKWVKKLTDDACLFALNALACGTPGKKIVEMIKDKYNVDISYGRIIALKSQKKWVDHYETFRNKYLSKTGNVAVSDMPSNRTRLDICKGQVEFILNRNISANLRQTLDKLLVILNKAISQELGKNEQHTGLLEFVRQQQMGELSDKEREKDPDSKD